MKILFLTGLLSLGIMSFCSAIELSDCNLTLQEFTLRDHSEYQKEDTIKHIDEKAFFWYQRQRLVRYIRDESKRAEYVMSVKNGAIQQGSSRIAGYAFGLFPKPYLYILSHEQTFYIAEQTVFAVDSFHHSSFTAGGNVLAAGMITIKGNRILMIDLDSGHYHPYHSAFPQTLFILLKQGFPLPEKIKFHAGELIMKDAIADWTAGKNFPLNGAYSDTVEGIKEVLKQFGYLN